MEYIYISTLGHHWSRVGCKTLSEHMVAYFKLDPRVQMYQCSHKKWNCRVQNESHFVCLHVLTWWRHQMETFSALLVLCAGIRRSPVNSPHKGQWRGALMFSLICAWINDWVNNREAGDLRRHRVHYDGIVMKVPTFHSQGLLQSWRLTTPRIGFGGLCL